MKPNRQTLLWLSVGLNVCLLSFVAVRYLKSSGPEGPGPSLFHLREAMAGKSTSEIDTRLRQTREELRPHRRALRQARKQVRVALEAETFNAAELASALENLRQQTLQLQGGMHRGFVEITGLMTPEQRHRLGELNWRSGGRKRRKERSRIPR